MDPLIPPTIQKLADAAGLTWNEYVNTLSPQDRANADREIVLYTELRNKQLAAGNRRDFTGRTLSGPLPEVYNPVLNASTPQGPTIEELEAGSQSPVLSTASTPQDPLLTNPEFIQMAETSGRTPEEHLAKLDPRILGAARKILLGVEPESPAPVLQTAVDPADRVGEEPGVLMRNEQNLVQENIGERQLLETRITDLEGSVDTQSDVARLQQMKQRLVELGGPVESNPSTPQYDAAAQAYLGQLRGQQEQAAAVAPDVRAAEAEIASTAGLLSSGTLPPEMMASVQARKAAAEAALASGNAARDARVADVAGSTLSVENPVNGVTAQSLGVQIPGQEPGMNGASDYTRPPPVPVDNSGMPSGLGPYTAPTPPTPILAGNEPGMNGASDYSQPVLINTTTPAPTANTTAAQTPALSTKSSTTATRTPALSRGAGNMTANARGSALGMVPRGESLIRIGGAMYSGALQGDGLGAATREYGSIQDANRAAEVAAAKQAEATRIAELRARGTGAGKAGSKSTEGAGDLRFGISKLQTALGMIRGSDGSLTGLNPSALFDRFMGKTIGNEQEAQRLFLNEIGLDSIMKRVAETKGAISNAEMALFGRQVPQLGSQEIVWERWLQRQLQMAELLLARAEGGITVDPNAPLSQTMPGLSGGGGAGSSNMSAADAIVGI